MKRDKRNKKIVLVSTPAEMNHMYEKYVNDHYSKMKEFFKDDLGIPWIEKK